MKHTSKRIVAMLLAVAMVLSAFPTIFASAKQFTDVSKNAWYAEYVDWAYEHDPQLMVGMTSDRFEPERAVSRAMVAVVLYRLSGDTENHVATFSDLNPNAQWYQAGIGWAQATGVVAGIGDNKFAPDDGATREQLIAMLYRYDGEKSVDGEPMTSFADYTDVSAYAEDAMNWAVAKGIIQGEYGKLLPQRVATRAEFARILYAYLHRDVIIYDAAGKMTELEPEVGDKLTPETPEAPEGMVFVGWATEKEGAVVYMPGVEITVEDDLTLYPIFEKTPYTVTIYNAEGEVVRTEEVKDGDTFTPEDPEVPEGKIFKGWATEKDGAVVYMPGEAIVAKENLELYPVSDDVPKYKVTLYNGEEIYDTADVYADGAYTIPADPTEGPSKYDVFLGWATEQDGEADAKYVAGSTITVIEPVALYAVWQTPEYTVTVCNADGEVTSVETVRAGEAWTPDPAKAPAHKVFAGWATEKGGEVVYEPGAAITVEANISLYPVFNDGSQVTVTLYNGEEIYDTAEVYGGDVYTIPAGPDEAPVAGNVFVGWSTEADGEIAYLEGDELTVTSAITLYVLWAKPEQKTSVNGHRDVFAKVAAGSVPDGFAAEGWGITTSYTIPNWWNEISTLESDGESYPYTVTEEWNHNLKHVNGGSDFAVYEDVYTDFDLTSFLRVPTGGTGALVFRYVDDQNYYYYQLTQGSADNVKIGKVVDGVDTELYTCSTTVNADTWYNLRVTMVGDAINVWINDNPHYINLVATTEAQSNIDGTQLATDVKDTDLTQGKVGYWSDATGDSSALFGVFAVSNLASDFSMENDTFQVTTGPYGQIKELYLKSDDYTNFVSNEETHREDVGENHFLGEIIFTYEVNGERYTASTGASDDNRVIEQAGNKVTVSYTTASEEDEGLRHFTVVETYTLMSDRIQFDIEIKNTSGEELTILDMGLPMMWNNHWQFQSPYTEYASATGYYVSYNGSWIQVESAGGGAEQLDGGQKILFVADNSTDAKLEYRRYASNNQSFGDAPETYYIYSDAIKSENQGYLESTSLTMAADQENKFSFQIYATDTYLDTEETLYESGSLDVQVNPGMVLPDDVTALVDIHTTKQIEEVHLLTTGKTAEITFVGTREGDHNIYSIQFANQGRNDVEIVYDGGKQSVLQFWVIDNVAEAMQSHVDFLMNTLRITDPSDPHYGSFNEYDNVTNTVLTEQGDGCSNNNYEQMYDGPAFIAEKNVYYPVQSEIDAMDVYLIDLVYAKELVLDQDSEWYGYMYFGCEAPGFSSYGNDANKSYNGYTIVSRVYNYPRVYNTFYSMYKAASNYADLGYTFRWEATEYLYWAGLLAVTGETISDSYWGPTGVMGEQTVPDIIEDLRKEGMTELADALDAAATSKGNNVANQDFPFGSEFSVDRTGEEGAYFLSKYVGAEESQIKAINKIMAWISKSPTWYQQTTGRTNDTDWWIFQYTVGLQAAALKDWYNTHNEADAYWSMIYPAAYSSFVHIKTSETDQSEMPGPVGTVFWTYWPTHPYDWTSSVNGGWPNQTGEADISLWAGLQILSTDVVLNDPSFGLTAYGGVASWNDGAIHVIPTDGLYTKLNVVGTNVTMEFGSDHYASADLTLDGDLLSALSVELDNITSTSHEAELSVGGLKAGTYQVKVNGKRQAVVTVSEDGAVTDFPYQVSENGGTLEILPYQPHEGPARVAIVGDDDLIGDGTSDWTVNGFAAQLETMLGENYTISTFIQSDADAEDIKAGSDIYNAVKDFNPDMVIMLVRDENATTEAWIEVFDAYQTLEYSPILYVITDPIGTGDTTAFRTAAETAGAVIADGAALVEAQPDLLQDNALNNNGAFALAARLYYIIGRGEAVKAGHDVTQPIDATEYDRQNGAHYVDVRSPGTETKDPYVSLDENGCIGFESLTLDTACDGVVLNVIASSDTTLKLYNGNPANGGRLIGQLDVNATTGFDDITVEVLDLTGVTELYISTSAAIDLKTVSLISIPVPEGAPALTDPKDVTAYESKTAAFTVTATPANETDTLSYQWQKSADEVNWTNIEGATQASYTTDTLTLDDDGAYFRVLVTANETVTVASETAKLTVLPMPTASGITITPAPAEVRVGASQTFTAAVIGDNIESLPNAGQNVTWTVDGAADAGNGDTQTHVREDGTLFVSDKETVGATLTLRATTVDYEDNISVEVTVTLTAALADEDVVLHYIFAEGSGDTVVDYSQNHYDGTITGNTTTSWQADGGYAFNGSSYIIPSAQDGSNASLVSSNMTLVIDLTRTGYINLAASLFWGMPYQNWAGNGMWINIPGSVLDICTNGARFNYALANGGTVSEFYTYNEPTQIAISLNSETHEWAVYRNGELVESGYNENMSITPSDDALNSIGMAGYDNEWLNNVTMNEYMIFDKALTEAEAMAIYNDSKFQATAGEPTYTGITVGPSAAEVAQGGSLQFDATVTGDYAPSQEVTWTVEGANAEGTAITEDGVLTVDEAETAETLTVKATSVNADKFTDGSNGIAVATVTVKGPKFTSVTVSPAAVDVKVGATQTFTAAVAGTDIDTLPNGGQNVTWSVSGAAETDTVIDAATGVLTVSASEEVDTTLTVTATAGDGTTCGTATVTVIAADITYNDIVLQYIFDGESGDTTVTDYSKNHYDGVISGDTTTAWTESGYAFDGASYITPGGSDANAQLVSNEMTIVYAITRTGTWDYISDGETIVWLKPAYDYWSNGVYISIERTNPVMVCTNSGVQFRVSGGMTPEEFYPEGETVEVAITIDKDGNWAVYRNGESCGTGTGAVVAPNTSTYLNDVGRAGYTNNYLNDLTMSKFTIFSQALTAENVKAAYEGAFDPVVADDLTLYYAFDEGQGSTLTDLSENSYNGNIMQYADAIANATVSENPTWDTEGGYKFDGQTYVQAPSDATLVSGDMSIVYRIKPTEAITSDQSFFWGKPCYGWAGNGMYILVSGSTPLLVSFGHDDAGYQEFVVTGMTTDEFWPVDEWTEVAITFSSTTGEVAVYRNGVKVETSTPSGDVKVTAPTEGQNTIGLAGYDNQILTNIVMDKYVIFDKALSQIDAQQVYADWFE